MDTEVFYTPHTDDETIGMAGSIIRAVDAGRHVVCVLVTDNRPSARGARLFPGDDTPKQRRHEWRMAMASLGVRELIEWEIPEQEMIDNPTVVQVEIERRIGVMQEHYKPRCHHTTWGSHDIHVELGQGSIAHEVCANALRQFSLQHCETKVQLHGVYIFSRPERDREAPLTILLDAGEHSRKRQAMNCYKAGPNSIGYGYRSVPELFDNASRDPREFVMEVA